MGELIILDRNDNTNGYVIEDLMVSWATARDDHGQDSVEATMFATKICQELERRLDLPYLPLPIGTQLVDTNWPDGQPRIRSTGTDRSWRVVRRA